jgi:TRAP-type C4-dicarboxylate transport system substrate-binding protein
MMRAKGILPVRLILPALAVLLTAAACGREETPTSSETAAAPVPTATQPPDTGSQDAGTEATQPTFTPESQPETPEPTLEEPEPAGPEATEAPGLEPTPGATVASTMTEAQKLAAYAAEYGNGPGAIFEGDPTQLIGPPPHEGLMFQFPEELYSQTAGAALIGSPQLQVPSHMFIYTSDYYKGLIEKANLTNPTGLASSGESIEIQHVCLDRQLPPRVLMQTYLAPNLAERTNGRVKISVISLAELQIQGPDTLTQVRDGTLDMVNIFTGYVAGEVPSLEVQSLWGSAPDWETSYLTLTDLAEDVDRLIEDANGGSPVLNRNWFAGSDQWMYSSTPLESVDDYNGLDIRTNSSSMSDFISGMGGRPVSYSIAELYTSLQQGIVDAAAYGALLAVSAKLNEVTDYMSGPIIGFGYTNNVINKDVWNGIPADLQQIMIEEGAKAEIEGLRLAPFQNVAAVQINMQLGMTIIPFSEEIYRHIQTVALPQHVIPGWLSRIGFPERNADIVAIYNEKSSPYSGIWINDDGSVKHVPITKGPRAVQ